MSEFRFAIMGAGQIAHKFVRAIGLLPDCCVCAIASRSLERAQAFAQKMNLPVAYGSYEEMLLAERPDCVYIAASTDLHAELSLLCLNHGVPVLCEKAMCRDSEEAKAVFSLAQEKGVFAMEALWTRFLPPIMKARQWLREGCIGDAVMAEVGVGFKAPDDPGNRYFNPEKGGGAAYDLSVYGYHLIHWILGREVIAMQPQVISRYGVDAAEMILLTLEGGLPAVIKASLISPVEERMVIYGSSGRIVIPNAHFASEAYLYDASGALQEHFVDKETVNGFTYEAAEVMRCIREGKRLSDVVPPSVTLRCAEMFDLINAQIVP